MHQIELLVFLSLTAAVVYGFFFCWRLGSVAKTLLKTACLALLAIAAYLQSAPLLLVGALALSAIGDAALAEEGDKRFLFGLVSFACAHIFYILLYVQLVSEVDQVRLVLGGLVFGTLALSTRWWLLPHTGELKIPVLGYVVLICIMGLLASQVTAVLMVGAMLFVLSDIVLSLQLFRMGPNGGQNKLVSITLWFLYYGGQALIFLWFSGYV